jgi:hypothetical protein
MDWIVQNARNTDVERQHLNKILAEIRASIVKVEGEVRLAANRDVQDIVGNMLSGEQTGIKVWYDATKSNLNFRVPNFTIRLTGDVTGTGTVSALTDVNIVTTLDSDVGISDAPNTGDAFWRRSQDWEQVPVLLDSLATLPEDGLLVADGDEIRTAVPSDIPSPFVIYLTDEDGNYLVDEDGNYLISDDIEPDLFALALTDPGILAHTGDDTWETREIEGPMSVVVTDGDGVAANPSVSLVNDELSPGFLESYATNMAGVKGWYKPALFESTGLLSGGALSVNAGDNTKFDIAAAVVGYTDYTINPAAPTRHVFQIGPFTAVTVTSLAVTATYIGIQMPGGTVVQQSSPYTATQTRTIIPLGAVISNGVNLIAVNNLPIVIRAGINQIQDFMAAIGPINISGNRITANAVMPLNLDKSAGVIFKQGSNFNNDPFNPHGLSLASLMAFNFNYRLSDGTQFATTNVIDPSNFENPLGVLTPVTAANRFTIQRISVFTSNLVRVQYGQFVYNTMAEAEASLATEAFVTETNIAENGILLAFLIVQDGAVDLSNPSQAKFVPASKFGGPVGTGGTSILNTDALPEGVANLYFTDLRAQTAVVVDSIADSDTTHAPSRNAVFDALALKATIPKGYIDGLQMQWVSGTALTVSSGSAYIPASANIVEAPSAIAKTSLSLSASTWYHVYLYLNAGTPDIEIVTTAPVLYHGGASHKTGDNSRRYLGSIKTDSGSNIYNFITAGKNVFYRTDTGVSPFRAVAGGVNTTETTVSLSALVPVTSRIVRGRFMNLDGAENMYTGTSDDSASGPPFSGIAALTPGLQAFIEHPLNSSQELTYWFEAAPAGAGFYLDLYGYTCER